MSIEHKEADEGAARELIREAVKQIEAVLKSGHMGQAIFREEFGPRLLDLLGVPPGILKEVTMKEKLGGQTWQEHFKANLPPKYEGVVKSGKVLPFFLKYYRGKKLDENNNLIQYEDEDSSKVDYVELGMTQAEVRRYDPKLLRAVRSAIKYGGDFELDKIVPPKFTTKNVVEF